MLLLNEPELERLRQRGQFPDFFKEAWANLEEAAAPVTSHKVPVPPQGIAGWTHNYYCPVHYAALVFDPASPARHRCSQGKEYLKGEIYDQAWWRKASMLLSPGVLACTLLWLSESEVLNVDSSYFQGAKRVLLEYAYRYPDYEIHGNIPYNGPGKANSQTLDEANWIIPLAIAYDILQSRLTSSERQLIAAQLLQPCAQFLVKCSEKQLHNHQCWIGAAIGTLGLVLNEPGLVEIALEGEWGLLRQLEEGILDDGMWCEGTLGYHLYAFDAFTSFARLHRDAALRVREHPKLAKMPKAALNLLLPDRFSFPLLNDTTPPLNIAQAAPRYELAAGWFNDPAYHWVLHRVYNELGYLRTSWQALLYGPEQIQTATEPIELSQDFHSPASGLTLLRSQTRRGGFNSVLLKYSPFGGEHDHGDRPGLYFGTARQPQLAADLGTVFYGLPLHYAYFKNTLTHNTVLLDNANQPAPSLSRATLTEEETYTRLGARCDWGGEASNGPYQGAVYRREIIIADEGYLLDIFVINTPALTHAQYTFHWRAVWQGLSPLADYVPTKEFSSNGPGQYLQVVSEFELESNTSQSFFSEWQTFDDPGQLWRLWCLTAGEKLVGQIATGPDNPFVRRKGLGFWLVRSLEPARRHCFIHVFEPRRSGAGLVRLKSQIVDDILELSFTNTTGPIVTRWQIGKLADYSQALTIKRGPINP